MASFVTAAVIGATGAGTIVSNRSSADGTAYFITDSLGSVVGLMDANGAFRGGYRYSPYGEGRASTATAIIRDNPIRYISGYQESGNVYKLGARYYDATTGRFTQMDPSGQEANPYAYAGNGPIADEDPLGLLSATAQSKIASGVSIGLGLASIAATATGIGAPAALVLGALSSGASVYSRGVVGDTSERSSPRVDPVTAAAVPAPPGVHPHRCGDDREQAIECGWDGVLGRQSLPSQGSRGSR